MITIVDYGMGNLGSIANMLRKIGVPSETTSDPAVIGRATKLVLPGVGAFDAGMANLESLGLIEVLVERATAAKVPILGICLGMQLMTGCSAEGTTRGLGWINANTMRFKLQSVDLKVPHMGWNVVRPARASELLYGVVGEQRYYFVHSYYVQCADPADVLLKAEYGVEFDAAFERGNIFGVQFHPEKSHRFGMRLLANFAQRVPC